MFRLAIQPKLHKTSCYVKGLTVRLKLFSKTIKQKVFGRKCRKCSKANNNKVYKGYTFSYTF